MRREAANGGGTGAGTATRTRPAASEDESGIAKLKRIVPRMK
jgi:hypothetical protein